MQVQHLNIANKEGVHNAIVLLTWEV
jgi:hypothetical protein